MLNHDLNFALTELKQKVASLKVSVDEMKAIVKPEEELWDNSDIIRNWKISSRLLSDWRCKGIIGFIQCGNKIWYPREARELFLVKYYQKTKDENENEENGN